MRGFLFLLTIFFVFRAQAMQRQFGHCDSRMSSFASERGTIRDHFWRVEVKNPLWFNTILPNTPQPEDFEVRREADGEISLYVGGKRLEYFSPEWETRITPQHIEFRTHSDMRFDLKFWYDGRRHVELSTYKASELPKPIVILEAHSGVELIH